MPTSLRVFEPPGLPQPPWLSLQPAASARRSRGRGGSGSAPGPSRIADYLLLPLAEREHVSRALCIHTGRELRCKVRTGGAGTRRRSRVRGNTVAGKSV